MKRRLSIALIVPFASESKGFFDDTLLGSLCSVALGVGHRAKIAHVYQRFEAGTWVGNSAAKLQDWLESIDAELIVVERSLDIAALASFRLRRPGCRVLLVSRGAPFADLTGVEFVLGAPGSVPPSGTRRTPPTLELVTGFGALLDSFASGYETVGAPEVYRVVGESLVSSPCQIPHPSVQAHYWSLSLKPELHHVDIIDSGAAPRIVRKTLLGNAGCSYSRNALTSPGMQGVTLPNTVPVSVLGCTFCFMGGDYQKRPRDVVLDELVEQALWITQHAPSVPELVLADLRPLRYLPARGRAPHTRRIRPIRWLFSARADTLLRQGGLIADALAAAECADHQIEAHLIGFESFCDRELERYNKGLTVQHLVGAVAALRELAAKHPGRFHYASARAHTLILWNPWTSPEDLSERVAVIRRHGLAALFSDIGSNRLRLYRDVPLTYAAERDGALRSEWDVPSTYRGYAMGRPWQFLDRRTKLAFALARQLKRTLGRESEVAQLAAVCALARRLETRELDVLGVERTVVSELDALAAVLNRLDLERGPGDPPRGCDLPAVPLVFAGACNNGCEHCSNADTWLPNDTQELRARLQAAQQAQCPILFAGREPSVHPAFGSLIERAWDNGRNLVGIVTNGRRFAYAGFTRVAARYLAGASVKLQGTRPCITDEIVRVDGAHEQAIAGARALTAMGVVVEIRAPLLRQNLRAFAEYLDVARACGARQIRIEASLDGIGLDRGGLAVEATVALSRRCAADGFPLQVSPLVTQCRRFDRLPIAIERHGGGAFGKGGVPC